MSGLYVEIYRPCYPEKGVKVRTHKEKDWSRDVLSPDMTAVFFVGGVTNKTEALAVIAEKLAGKTTDVRKIFG